MKANADWLARQAAVRPDRIAIEFAGEGRSFRELDRAADRWAFRFGRIPAGARVGILLDNGFALPEAVLGCLRTGRVAVLLDSRLPASELRRLGEAGAPAAIVADAGTEERGREVAESLGVPLVRPADTANVSKQARGGVVALDEQSPALVVFSSGTTGPAKPIELSLGNLLASALGSASRLGATFEDRWLACLPLSHLGGLSILFRSVLFGSTMVLQPGFSAPAVASALAERQISMVSLVPTTLARLLDEPRLRAPALRCALIGGARAPVELLERARSVGFPVSPTYGLTETASQVATLDPAAPLVESGHVGLPILGTEVGIEAQDGTPAEAGEVGRIRIRGRTVAAGARSSDGWLRTGDLGRLNESGGLVVLGRQDDVIVTGGETVAPEEVEVVLATLPEIEEVAVAPVEDPEWGHVVGAWVVPAAGADLTLDGLRAEVRDRLAPHKLPRHLAMVRELPRTALGKIRRRELPGRG